MRSKIITITCILVLSICSGVFIGVFTHKTVFEEICHSNNVTEPEILLGESIYSGTLNKYERLYITDDQEKTVIKLLNSIKPVKNPKSYEDYIWLYGYHSKEIDHERIKFCVTLLTPSGLEVTFSFRSPEEVIVPTNLIDVENKGLQLKQFSCSEKMYDEIMLLALSSAIYEFPDEVTS